MAVEPGRAILQGDLVDGVLPTERDLPLLCFTLGECRGSEGNCVNIRAHRFPNKVNLNRQVKGSLNGTIPEKKLAVGLKNTRRVRRRHLDLQFEFTEDCDQEPARAEASRYRGISAFS